MNTSPLTTGVRRQSAGWSALLLCACLQVVAPAEAADFDLSEAVHTHPDGRMPIEELYRSYLQLLEKGWRLDVISHSQPEGRAYALPIIALRTPHEGEAVWILSGIHGEEPAGPNAIAASIEAIAEMGEQRAVVLLPLNNPQGYAHNWRYLNMPVYSQTVEGQSVGDSSHLLAKNGNPGVARAPAPSSAEAAAITDYVLQSAANYPPSLSIDLHEDNLIDAGYVYSQGSLGASDPLALAAVEVLVESGIPLKMDGQTRFGETIAGGVIGPVTDGSLDELMSADWIVLEGRPHPGPAARTVLVFETPAREVSLRQRVGAHAALLERLAEILAGSTTEN